MENRQALKLIEKIQKELFKDNFEVSEIVTDLKKLREITLELNNPVVTKALRLAYEHLENNNGFFIGIPDVWAKIPPIVHVHPYAGYPPPNLSL